MKTVKERFIDRQMEHLRKVQDNMILLEKNLNRLPFKIDDFEILRRGMQHDLDKFSAKLFPHYLKIEEYKYNERNGIPNKEIDKDELYACCKEHRTTQRHHYDFHRLNGTELSDIDICEICCDSMAVSEREGNDPIEYFRENVFPRGEISKKRQEEIVEILNLLKELKNK